MAVSNHSGMAIGLFPLGTINPIELVLWLDTGVSVPQGKSVAATLDTKPFLLSCQEGGMMQTEEENSNISNFLLVFR